MSPAPERGAKSEYVVVSSGAGGDAKVSQGNDGLGQARGTDAVAAQELFRQMTKARAA